MESKGNRFQFLVSFCIQSSDHGSYLKLLKAGVVVGRPDRHGVPAFSYLISIRERNEIVQKN